LKILEILTKIKQWADSDRPIDIMIIALNEVNADYQNRIFNSEQGYRDTKGNAPQPTYSNPYAEKRSNAGRQIKHVDFEFTGALRRSINLVRESTGVKLVLNSAQEARIAQYLELQRNTKIFDLSENEKKELSTKVASQMVKDLKQIFDESM
jgi:hypothetical protein